MGFPRQEYRSGLEFPSPGDLPDPGIEPKSSALAGRLLIIWATREAHQRAVSGTLTLPFLSAFPTQEHPHLLGHNALEKEDIWTSLVVQWIRIHLPKQGTRGWSLIQEDSTHRGATKPHIYWAHTWAREPQLLTRVLQPLKPVCSRARALQQEKALQWEASVTTTRETHTQQWRPHAANK